MLGKNYKNGHGIGTITSKRAPYLARKHVPVFCQGYENAVDIPTEINFGPFKIPKKPVVYYWIRIDRNYFYLGYALYHYSDYTKCVPAKILGLGEHRHDFEGVITRVKKYLPHHKPDMADALITVAHTSFYYAGIVNVPVWKVIVESRGHGIYPIIPIYFSRIRTKNILEISNPKLISMDRMSESELKTIQDEFNQNGVHMPWQWTHEGKYKGLFWNNPAKLFDKMGRG